MSTIRSNTLTVAVALTVAAAVSGATLKGETREARLDETCAHETWPAIPVHCLTGNVARAVRAIPIDSVSARDMRARFEIAFE